MYRVFRLIGNSGQKSANRKQWEYQIPSNRKQGFIEISIFFIHPRPYKRTGDQFWSRTGRATICWCFLLKNIGKTGQNSRKKLDGRQKIVVGGRARPKYRPSFYTGGCRNYYKLVSFTPQK